MSNLILYEVEDGVGLIQGAALLDNRVGGGAQALDPFLRDDAFEQQVTVGKIEATLFIANDFGRVGEDFFGCHG